MIVNQRNLVVFKLCLVVFLILFYNIIFKFAGRARYNGPHPARRRTGPTWSTKLPLTLKFILNDAHNQTRDPSMSFTVKTPPPGPGYRRHLAPFPP